MKDIIIIIIIIIIVLTCHVLVVGMRALLREQRDTGQRAIHGGFVKGCLARTISLIGVLGPHTHPHTRTYMHTDSTQIALSAS